MKQRGKKKKELKEMSTTSEISGAMLNAPIFESWRCFYVCRLSVAETWPLFTGAEQKHRNRILGEVGKSSFYFFARQRQPQQANALKTV